MRESKVCSKCKELKQACDFGKRGNSLRSHCKLCDKKYRESKKIAVVDAVKQEPTELFEVVHKPSLFNRIIKWIMA